jgi:hypothetical protein
MIALPEQDDLLALYDREMRLAPPVPGPTYRCERTDRVVRLVGPSAATFDNCVLFSRLDDATADAAIRREIDHFGSRGRSFEWKLHDHDKPEDLPARLLRHGFTPEARETVVVRPLPDIPPRGSTSAADVRKVDGAAPLADLVAVQNEVWNEDHVAFAEALAAERASDPTRLEILIAYDGPRPVATSWLRLHRGTSFASCWGGATLSAWRPPVPAGRACFSPTRTPTAARCSNASDSGRWSVFRDSCGDPPVEPEARRRYDRERWQST